MAKAIKLPSGKYRCRVYNKYTGKQVSFTEDSKKEAERKATLFMLTLQEPEEIRKLTFGEAAEEYIMNHEGVLSPNTLRDYRYSLRLHCEEIKNVKIEKLTDRLLQSWVNKLSKILSPKTIKNIWGFFTVVMRSVDPHAVFSVTLPKKIRVDMKMPSEADVKAILEAVKGTDIEVPVKLAVYCCLRRGEISALLLSPECLGKDTVTIKYSMIKVNGEWHMKAPKTYSSYRTVPCPEWLIKETKNAPYVHPGYITDKWIKLMKKLGYSYRFHDMRHFSASSMLTVMPVVDVEKFGGWRHGSAVLQDIYTYNIDESLKKSAAAWQEKVKDF